LLLPRARWPDLGTCLEMLTKNCQNCYYWSEEKWKEETQLLDKESLNIRGQCLRMLHCNEDSLTPSVTKEIGKCPAVVMDGSGYWAVVFTLPSFSCSEWKAKEDD